MKKILLATTLLAGTAGAAAADVSFSGGAYTGVAYTFGGTLGNAAFVDARAWLVPSMTLTTDGGLEMGASLFIGAPGMMVQKDPSDNEFGAENWAPGGGFVSGTTIYVSGSWGKVTFAYDTNADDSNATAGDYDLQATYSNTWGNFGMDVYGVYAPAASTATTSGDFGATLTYSFGDYSVYGDVFYDNSDADGNKIDLTAGAEATVGGFSAAAEVTFDLGSGWYAEGSVGYATGPYSVSAFATTDQEYGLEAAYDLGGGAAIEAGYAYSNGVNSAASGSIVYAGVSMSF